MRMNPILVALTFLLGTQEVANADPANLERARQIFTQSWNEDYRPTECGDNVMRFLKRLQAQNVDLTNARVLLFLPRIPGEMLNVERARNEGRDTTYERNWFFHVALQVEGYVFDLDFMSRPTPEKTRTYLDRMFFSEINPPAYPHLYVGRAEKLRYKIETYPAGEYLATKGARDEESAISLGEYLNRL